MKLKVTEKSHHNLILHFQKGKLCQYPCLHQKHASPNHHIKHIKLKTSWYELRAFLIRTMRTCSGRTRRASSTPENIIFLISNMTSCLVKINNTIWIWYISSKLFTELQNSPISTLRRGVIYAIAPSSPSLRILTCNPVN